MTPNRFDIVKDRGPGELDLIRSFLTFRLMLSQQIPVALEIGRWQEEGLLYVSGLRHTGNLDRYQFWGELYMNFADQEDHPRNRFEVEGSYDSRKREGHFWIDPLTPYRLVFAHDGENEYRGFFGSLGQYHTGIPDSLLETVKKRHWYWEDPQNVRYFFEHLEFQDLESSLIDPSLGNWRPVGEIRVTGDEQNPEVEIINL